MTALRTRSTRLAAAATALACLTALAPAADALPALSSAPVTGSSAGPAAAAAAESQDLLPTGTLAVRRAVWDAERRAGHRLFDVTFPAPDQVHFVMLPSYDPDRDHGLFDEVVRVARLNGMEASAAI